MSIVNLFQLSPPTVLIALIFFIMKFYLLFRINFIWKSFSIDFVLI